MCPVNIDYNVYVSCVYLDVLVDSRHGIFETLLSPSLRFLATREHESFLCQVHDSKSGIYNHRNYGTSLSFLVLPNLCSSITLTTIIRSDNVFHHDQEISARPSPDTMLCAGDLYSSHHLHLPFCRFS
jgi:hypothetical protein